MNRRRLLQTVAATVVPFGAPSILASAGAQQAAPRPASRVRPGDSGWPSSASWERLNRDVGGRLIEVRSPFGACRGDPVSLACDDLFAGLKNPYYIGDDVALTQTTGWVDATRFGT